MFWRSFDIREGIGYHHHHAFTTVQRRRFFLRKRETERAFYVLLYKWGFFIRIWMEYIGALSGV